MKQIQNWFPNTLRVVVSVALVVVVAQSCNLNNPFKEYSKLFGELMVSDEALLREVEPGMTLAEVKKAETATLVDQDQAYLNYAVNKDSLSYYNIVYTFDQDTLTDIQLDVALPRESQADSLYHEFKRYFDTKYGASVIENGYTIWKTKNSRNQDVEFTLADESADFGSGRISLVVYKFY